MKTNSRRRSLRPAGIAAAVLLLLPGCDFGIDSVNVDTTRLRSVEPQFQLNDVIVGSAPPTAEYRCEASVVQQHLRVFTGVGSCANFNVATRNNMGHQWGGYGRLNELRDVVIATQDEPSKSNLYNMARIMRAYTFMKITDTYGDVPFTEASQARDGVVFPAYDDQEFIYTSPEGILEELKNASAALIPSQTTPNEALYGGNVGRWQRFGNSLLLRAGMRLTKVNPGLAQQYVQAAVNNPGGLMQSNADNAVVRHSNDYRNPMGATMNSNEGFNEYMPATFLDHLKANGDPRLRAMAVRYPTAVGLGGQTAANGVTDPAQQIGMPMGYDNNTVGEAVQEFGLPSLYAFSQTDRRRMFDVLAPNFLVTYAQTQLLLAEAAARGWVTGSAATYFANGVRADMERISSSYTNTPISSAEITAYLAAHPLNTSSLQASLEQINTEYWVASNTMPHEAWSNFRRSGYPDEDIMPPNPLKGDLTTEDFFRRLLYPEDEINLNPNYDSGTMPDIMDTRVWWDVQ